MTSNSGSSSESKVIQFNLPLLQQLKEKFNKYFSNKLNFLEKDQNAVYVYTVKKELNVFDGIFIGLNFFYDL